MNLIKWNVLIVLLIVGCSPNVQSNTNVLLETPAAGSAPAIIPSLEPSLTLTLRPSITPAPTFTVVPSLTPQQRVARVLIISVDGLRPDVINLAPMPVLQGLMVSGASSMTAQTIFPSATLPAHASMLLGVCPFKHGVNWNEYIPERGYAVGTSIFDLAHRAGLKTIMIVGKEKMRQLVLPESSEKYLYINDRDVVIAEQAVPILMQGFDLAFIHLPLVDGMGHEHGWLSAEQLSVARRADEAVGMLLDGLKEAGILENTLIIISADHGGHDQTHGSRQAEDMTIPWIINGPGVVPGLILQSLINTTDTAATTAYALSLIQPTDWDGLPVLEAFGREIGNRTEPRCP